MNGGYFFPENMKITPVTNCPNYIEHSLNVYKTAQKPTTAPIKKDFDPCTEALTKLAYNE